MNQHLYGDLGDMIFKQTVDAMEQSKSKLYHLTETLRVEMEKITTQVESLKCDATDVMVKVAELERKERMSRLHILEVSRKYRDQPEQDIKVSYEEASQKHIDLAIAREKQSSLKRQLYDLEARLKECRITVQKTEGLISKIGGALSFIKNQAEGSVTLFECHQQQVFGARIIKAQEEERKRVAREIHDGPAQAMANIAFRAEVCRRLLDTDLERSKAELQELSEQVQVCLQETRKIIFNLRPMTLDDLGLVPTVRRILNTYKERTGTAVDVKVFGEEKRLDSHIELGLFRIVQEALTNTEKHAKASNVRIRIEFAPKAMSVIFEDDGIGFDDKAVVKNENFGLMGMRERASLLEGELAIKSGKGKGTKIIVRVPLTA